MSNSPFNKMFALLLLVSILLACISGCAVRKQTKMKRQERKEIMQLHTDSLFSTHRKEQETQRIYYRQQLHLSAPDSAGRQYIRSVTQAISASCQSDLRQDTVINNSTAFSALQQTTSTEQVKVNRRTSPGWRWLAVIICIFGIITFVRYFNSRTIS